MLIFNDILIPGRRGVRSLIAAGVDMLIYVYYRLSKKAGCLYMHDRKKTIVILK